MANSSQSGNILGYASGTQPGLVSTVAQTFAGKKTLDGGALIKGDTSGVAIATGYVGEKITWASAPTDQTLTTTEADWTNATITLTPGIWLVLANVSAIYSIVQATGNYGSTVVKITDSSNTVVENQVKVITAEQATTTSYVAVGCSIPFAFYQNVTGSSKTLKIRVLKIQSVGTGIGVVYNTGNKLSEFFAVRIA